jgi:hypothetical protein
MNQDRESPVFVFKGRECGDCDATTEVVFGVISKTDTGQELTVVGKLPAPGRMLANPANYDEKDFQPGPIYEGYVFQNMASGCAGFPPNSFVWFEYLPRTIPPEYSTTVVTPGQGNKLSISKSASILEVLASLKKDAAAGKCVEVKGEDETESP